MEYITSIITVMTAIITERWWDDDIPMQRTSETMLTAFLSCVRLSYICLLFHFSLCICHYLCLITKVIDSCIWESLLVAWLKFRLICYTCCATFCLIFISIIWVKSILLIIYNIVCCVWYQVNVLFSLSEHQVQLFCDSSRYSLVVVLL